MSTSVGQDAGVGFTGTRSGCTSVNQASAETKMGLASRCICSQIKNCMVCRLTNTTINGNEGYGIVISDLRQS
jgi:hypothetical protein